MCMKPWCQSLFLVEWQKGSWNLLHKVLPSITNFSIASCFLLVSHKLLILPNHSGCSGVHAASRLLCQSLKYMLKLFFYAQS